MQVIVSIRDLSASAFVHTRIDVSDGCAVRSFGDAVCDGKSMLSAHPQDFELFRVGTFDERTGAVTAEVLPVRLAAAIEFVKQGASNA